MKKVKTFLFVLTAMLVLDGGNKTTMAGALYDMDRFLFQPHPFANQKAASRSALPRTVPIAPEPVPAAQFRPGKFYRDSRPLPASTATGGQGMVSAPPSARRRAALWKVVSELRLGVLSHDVKFPSNKEFNTPNPFDHRRESGVNLNPEVVFVSPGFLDLIWSPRPHIGLTANLGGDTNTAYTGLGWDAFWGNGLFLEGFLGMAIHDGKLRNGKPDNIEFGSRVLFRLGGEFGWRWNDANGVSLIWEHLSNAGVISDKNQGSTALACATVTVSVIERCRGSTWAGTRRPQAGYCCVRKDASSSDRARSVYSLDWGSFLIRM